MIQKFNYYCKSEVATLFFFFFFVPRLVFAVPYTIEAILQQICIIFNGGCISKLIWNDGTVPLV